MKKTAVLIMAITIFSKVFGFIREIILSYLYGASNISDAYLISITIPGVIFSFIAAGIGAGFIPMYTKIVQNNGEVEANKFTNNLINILFLLSTIIILVGLLFTDQIVKIFASGFERETFELTVQFTRISLLAIYFIGIVSIFSGYLQVKGNYIIPALIGIPLNFFIILSFILSQSTNILVLSIGYLIAISSQLLLMIPFMRKKNYKYKLIFNLKETNIIKIAYIAIPIILGVSVNQINMLVDRTIASQIAVGGISALNYANRLNGFVQGIFVLSIATVVYPVLSKMAVEKNEDGLKKSLSEAVTGINLLVIPATIGSILFATPIISLLFGRGAFDNQAISMTSYAFVFYSIGMIGFGLREILSRTFYAIQDTKTPMINATIGMVLNIFLNIILSKYMGIGGLALATSIAAIFTTVLLFISLRKKIGSFGEIKLSISFLKIVIASLIMGILTKQSFNQLIVKLSQEVALIISIGVGVLLYVVIISFMKLDGVDVLVKALKRKMKKQGVID